MKKLILLAAFTAAFTSLRAEEAAFQLSLTPDIALRSRTDVVHGLALNIWGENPQHSLNLGFVNGSTGVSSGLSWALIANYADSYSGVQWGLVNLTVEESSGWQGGLVNCAQGSYLGLQIGVFNFAKEFQGLQLGVINYTERLDGLQVGFVNVARNNSWFEEFPDKLATGFPFVNWSF